MPNGHRKPWDGTRTKSGEITATAAWKRVGAKVLKRDRNECQLRLPGCTGHATQVDHILNVAAGGPELDPTKPRQRMPTLQRPQGTERGSSRTQPMETTARETPRTPMVNRDCLINGGSDLGIG